MLPLLQRIRFIVQVRFYKTYQLISSKAYRSLGGLVTDHQETWYSLVPSFCKISSVQLLLCYSPAIQTDKLDSGRAEHFL